MKSANWCTVNEMSHRAWFENTGYWPKKGEVVHHINRDHSDNRFENLWLCKSQSEHKAIHNMENGHPMSGRTHSEEWRRSHSELMKGNKHLEGYFPNEETRKKIGEASKRNWTEERRKASRDRMNAYWTPERRAAMKGNNRRNGEKK